MSDYRNKRYIVLTPRGRQWDDGSAASICDACLPVVKAELKPGWKLKEVPSDKAYICFHCQGKTPGKLCEDD